MQWRPLLSSSALEPDRVVPVDVDGAAWVLWRSRAGGVCGTPRWCAHLDWDLADAGVAGDEVVCPGHGWSFDCVGQAFKRNEFGRMDAKGAVVQLDVRERDGMIEVRAAD